MAANDAPVFAYLHGIYPRSETLVAATRDLERDRTTAEKVDEQFRRESEDLLDLQREAGLDFLSDGLLRWQDIFRPLVEGSRGLDARVLVRWFDNNSFFRAPEVTAPPALEGLPPWVLEGRVAEPRVATLPSPYLFSRAARSDGDRDALMLTLARSVLRPAAAAFAEAGHRLIHLQEPWLAYFGIEAESWPPFEEALGEIRQGAAGATVVLHAYFGDAAPHADRLRQLPVDVVGIDFVETDVQALNGRWDSGILVGCLDGRRSLVESVEGTVNLVRRVADTLEPPAVYLSAASDLELLSADVARGKVLRLGEAADRLREALR